MAPQPRAWWKEGVCYQVWPASYKDSNGDGLGDIQGIIGTLDYLKDLGIDIIWLSPMYSSPQNDMGYDISNYEDVYPPYGTLADMDQLIAEMKKRDMKLLLDLVINHTSSEHAWFLESRKDKTNPKHDWYHWLDPKYIDGVRHPPTNWRAAFGGGVWEYAPERDQYYLHLFDPTQPDLNWEKEEVRRAIYDTSTTFWLKRGVDGFRMDVFNLWSKDMSFPNAPITNPDSPYQSCFQFTVNGPRMHEWVREFRKDVLDPFGDIMTVGECPGTDFDETLKYVSAARNELGMVFDFDILIAGGGLGVPRHKARKPDLTEIKRALQKVQRFTAGTDAWASVFGENHDCGRSLSRFATDVPEYRSRAAKLLATMFATLTGTLFIYQGQEIGMCNMPSSWTHHEFKDVAAINYWKEIQEQHPDDHDLHMAALRGLQLTGRDNARTPVQWDGSANAGFTTGTPWMRVHDNYQDINVASQLADPENSVHGFWKRMLALRKEYLGLFVYGGFEMLDEGNEETFTFVKRDPEMGVWGLVALNFTAREQKVLVPGELEGKERRLLISNVEGVEGEMLGAWEARVYLFK